MLFTIPVEASFSQTCPSSNHCSVALGLWRALIQYDKIFRGNGRNAVSIGFEIVNEPHRGQAKLLGKLLCIYYPRQVDGLTATTLYRPSNPKTGVRNTQVMGRDERADNVTETGIGMTGKRLFNEECQMPLRRLETR